MRKYKTVQVTVEQEVAEAILCDGCGVDIATIPRDHYFEVLTSHSNWGSSSIESTKERDFCSQECLHRDMQEYFKKPQWTENYDIECVRKPRKE